MDYLDLTLTGPDGSEDNMGGLLQKAYLAPIKNFLAIQKPMAVPVTPADEVEIDGPHTFKTGFCFFPVYCTMDKGKMDLKSQGDVDGKSFKQEFEIFYPGSKSEAHAFAAQAKNDNFICLLPHPDSDVNGLLQVGTENFPAKIDPEFTTATNSSGVKGYMFKGYAMTNKQFIYKDAVPLTPAV